MCNNECCCKNRKSCDRGEALLLLLLFLFYSCCGSILDTTVTLDATRFLLPPSGQSASQSRHRCRGERSEWTPVSGAHTASGVPRGDDGPPPLQLSPQPTCREFKERLFSTSVRRGRWATEQQMCRSSLSFFSYFIWNVERVVLFCFLVSVNLLRRLF